MIELFSLKAFQNALLASLFGGCGLSLVGVFVILMDLPFLGIAMSHSALLGAVIGLLFGFNPLAGAIIACALSSIVIGPAADRSGASSNSILAILFSASMGAAFLLMSLMDGPKSEALNLIWGSILTISRPEAGFLGLAFFTVIGLLVLFYKELSAVLFNREIAASSGIKERFIYYAIISSAGLIISASLDIVGGLLIFTLLVNPASAANQLTYRLKTMFLLSALFGFISCVTGLIFSYIFDLPTGAVIVIASSIIFLFSYIFSPKRGHEG